MSRREEWAQKTLSLCLIVGLLVQPFPFVLRASADNVAPSAVRSALPAVSEPAAPATVAQPTALERPLSLSRVQSSYISGGPTVITYTVTNNQLATLEPTVPVGAVYTDTVNILSTFVLTEDMNTLSDPALVMTVTNGTILDANGADQNGSTLTWYLLDLPPQTSALITVTLAAPASAPDFVAMDTGAVAAGTLWNESVSTAARPTTVIPDAIASTFTAPTVDADAQDGDMLWAAADFDQDPIAAFFLVRSFGYDPYKGSLRGTRGTLWGEAGNSVDQASLLIAMLRAAGIPARYRHGSLSVPDAQTLLASMFSPVVSSAGYLPQDADTADPVNDPSLIALAQDHWWVEAYLPGQGWTDMDPSFSNAQVGDSFATPGASDRIAELPDTLRHTLYLELEVEKYSSFPVGGANLTSFVPLSGTYSTAQVAGKAVILGHIVESDAPGGMVYSTVEHVYTPYFGINGDELVTAGESFADLLTNFPLASTFTTAEWLTFELTDTDGNTQRFTREVKDLIGAGTRLLGGNLSISPPEENAPFISFEDSFSALFLPHFVGNRSFARRLQTRLQQDILILSQTVNELPREDLSSPEVQTQVGEAALQIERIRSLLFGLSGLEFTELVDPMVAGLQENIGVKLYYDIPRIIIMQGSGGGDGAATGKRTMDLRNTTAQAVVAPGYPLSAAGSAHWVKAIAESYAEGEALRDVLGQTPVTVARIFEEAQLQGIDFVYLGVDQMDLLDLYFADPNAYGYAAAALIEGKEVLIPQAPVLIDGKMRLGWWEIAPDTGAAVSVLDNGLHGALLEYAELVRDIVQEILQTWEDFGKSVDQLWNDCIVDNVVPALQGGAGRSQVPACLSDWSPPGRDPAGPTSPWFYLPDHLCPIDNCGIRQFVGEGVEHASMPLPETPFQYALDALDPADYAGQVIEVIDSGGGGTPAFTLSSSGEANIIPLEAYDLGIAAEANFDGHLDVWAYVPAGWSVGFPTPTQLQIVAPEGTPAGLYKIQIVGQSQQDRGLLATAQHLIAVPEQEIIDLAYDEEPNITIPVGPDSLAVSNQTNDGEAEIPGSAFRLTLTNKGHITQTISLTVSGAPETWLILDGLRQDTTVVTLPPFNRTRIGLYVAPPTRPVPGTSFTMVVDADAGGGLFATVSIPWTMAGQAHSFLQAEPDLLFMTPNSSQEFNLNLGNVGNVPGSFPISASVPISTWFVTGLASPVNLDVDASAVQAPTLHVTDAEVGSRVPLWLASPAPASYTQYERLDVQIVSPLTGPVYQAAESCNVGSEALAASLGLLAHSMTSLENSCTLGACDLVLRDDVVAAAESAALYAAGASPLLTAGAAMQTAADSLATQTDDPAILAELGNLSAAVTTLSLEACEIEEHEPDARFDPYLNASLLGETASFTLTVMNKGTLTTTYAVTVTGPAGQQTFNPSVAPGDASSLTIDENPGALGSFEITADVVPTGPGVQFVMAERAVARLNVVDRFVQLTRVGLDPPFVETGLSSTNLAIEVTNVAGIAQDVTAHAEIRAQDGTVQWTDDVPLSLRIGNPREYALATVDTSGWAGGLYTATVELGIADGSGYGHLSVGEAVGATHAVVPATVPPGAVTVTTQITTALLIDSILPNQPVNRPVGQSGDYWAMQPSNLAAPLTRNVDGSAGQISAGRSEQIAKEYPLLPSQRTVTGTVILRQEEDEATLVGAWGLTSETRASNGSYRVTNVAGRTAAFTFDGSWASVGFIGNANNGLAEVFIDGVSQGTLDLYRREIEPISALYTGLVSATHTLSITVLGSSNPLANGTNVRLDYLDSYSAGTFPHGVFEQDGTRVFRSTGWSNVGSPEASGDSYMRDNAATAWFPFTGDSVTYQAIAYNGAGIARLFIDGQYRADLNLYSPTVISRSLSFTGLSAGPHILQVSSHQGVATVDAFVTPSTGANDTPPTIPGFTRYEEDDPAMLFNGLPFTITARSWTRDSFITEYSEASGGQVIYCCAIQDSITDTVSFTFDGAWVSIGFLTNDRSGYAEIFLDGASQGVVDLYSNETGGTSFTYGGLVSTTHTISVTVLGAANDRSNGTRVNMDYVDVWDGNPLSMGQFEENDARVLRSGGWSDTSEAGASGGGYAEETLNGDIIAWFPFSGDSVTYQAFNYFRADEVAIFIDEVFQGYFDIRDNSGVPTITHSFEGLGAGLHMMKVAHYRNEAVIDAFHSPAISPPSPPPPPTTFTRTEEDGEEVFYGGLPYAQSARSWDRTDDNGRASDGQYIESAATGDWVSLDFSGTWVNVGFLTSRFGGQAEVFIDGLSQGTLDLYTTDPDVASYPFGGLTDTNHTISVTVLGSRHPNSSGFEVAVDYFDIWDGTTLPDGTYQEFDPLVSLSDNFDDWEVFNEPTASGGVYIADDFFSNDGTAWFPFTGESVSVLGLAERLSDRVEIAVDGVSRGTFNLYSADPASRTITFDALGPGPHVLQLRHNRGELNVDAFAVPGIGAPTQTPVYTGVVRYEEDNPTLIYNGLDNFRRRPFSWSRNTTRPQVSGRWMVSSNTAGDTVALTFDGRWANVGFRTINNAGVAEIWLDGVSRGLVNLDNDASEDVASYQFADLITGTHTISVSVVSGAVHVDYIEVWDGQPTSDEYVNVHRAEDIGRIHYSASVVDDESITALEGDYARTSLQNNNANVWFTFIGDAFTYLAYSRQIGATSELFVDGVLVDTVDHGYPFTEQPLAFHYDGFAPGPHVVRVHNVVNMRIDAFQANPVAFTPFMPQVEWYDNEPAGNGAPIAGTVGIGASIAAGDVTGDGDVEIVVAADDMHNFGTLFLYKGDGSDAGNGGPVIWEIPFGGGVFRTWLGSPSIADLDGEPGTEIVVNAGSKLHAIHADSTTYWEADTVPAFEVMSSPAIANLDLEDAPEIVVNVGDNVYVFEHDGQLIWQTTLAGVALPPILADITGDGLQDIFLSSWDDEVYLYEFNLGSPQLAWSATLSSTLSGMFGSAAVADIDGNQPGGDDGPEIAVSSFGRLTILNDDGSVLWSTELDPGNPGGVSIADIDGDGEIEIVTGMKYDDGIGEGRLYALNADGSLLWSVPAYDNSSANVASVLDLDGDGIHEVAWNGKQDGLTIFNGADGAVLFNEPLVFSLTGTDYPAFVDVDLDGYAELIAPSLGGLRVFGNDGVWGPARPLWNQHTYHITNINDDLSVPVGEANSWEVHNTYRTQTDLTSPLPSYMLAVTHTVALTGVVVLSDTFSTPPTIDAYPRYRWDYGQTAATPIVTRTFQSALADMQPGEVRQVAEETVVDYSLASGTNRVGLPPLFVTAGRLGEIAPEAQTVLAGATAVFALTLSNSGGTADTYSLALSGIPPGWAAYPAQVDLDPGGVVTVTIAVAVPDNAAPDTFPLILDIVNSAAGTDQIVGSLTVVDGVDLDMTPAARAAAAGELVTYTLVISNFETIQQSYALSATGSALVSLPPQVDVAAESAAQVVITASAQTEGPHPFSVLATSLSGAADTVDAVIAVTHGSAGVAVALAPDPAVTGPGSTAVMTVTVANTGQIVDTYALSVTVPAGWAYSIIDNGQAVDAVTLPPGLFESRQLGLLVEPDAGATIGDYPVTVTASSQSDPAVSSSQTGTVHVSDLGVQIVILSGPATVDPRLPAVWDVEVTNTGLNPDFFDLQVAGIFALVGTFSADTVALDPGQSQTVQFTGDNMESLLPGANELIVAAQSSTDGRIIGQDEVSVTIEVYEAVTVTLSPASQVVTGALTASFTMIVTNTANTITTYELTSVVPGALSFVAGSDLALPIHSTGLALITVVAPTAGTYTVTGTATSASGPASASGTALLTFATDNQAPVVDAGPDQTVDEGEEVAFQGVASDPEGQPLVIAWDFGDGTVDGGSLTPSHTFVDDGQFVVTLVVTDAGGLSTADALTVTVSNVAPSVEAGADRIVVERGDVALSPATFSDPGLVDAHVATIDWGDGTIEPGLVDEAAGTVSGSHYFDTYGDYTVVVTVTDDDGGENSDTFLVSVVRSAIYFPAIMNRP